MANKKPFEPNLKTPQDKLSKEELNKLASNGMRGTLAAELRNDLPDISWEAEQLGKSHGFYLEFNRAKTGTEKDWMYLIRIGIPAGGPITQKQWILLDELSEKYCIDPEKHTSLRLTNRQAIQFHWVPKHGVLEIVKRLAESGLFSLNGCGDNTRNVLGCPISQNSEIFDANALAQQLADYFRLPLEPFIEIFEIDPTYLRKPEESFQYGPQLLNRKFKIAVAAVHKDPVTGKLVPDNCVELRTNDLGIAPIVENNQVTAFQIYIGGGQGERNGKPSLATMGLPLCRVSKDKLLKVADAIVKVHKEWGDRENRFWSRLKYVIKKMGIEWYRQQVEAMVGFKLEAPIENFDYGARHMHHGWITQPNGKLTFGAFIENGRITDHSPNGKLKTMVRELVKKYPDMTLHVTPNQDLLFRNLPPAQKAQFEQDLQRFGHGKRNGKEYSTLRLLSGACVGRDTCRLTYTDSEKFEPFLIDDLEAMGWGNLHESIGITGCERQCFRPSTKTIGLVGSGLDRYQLRLFGSEDGRNQGTPLISSDGEQMYLRSIPREKVAVVIDSLLKYYTANKQNGEDLGTFNRRVGPDSIIAHFKADPNTAELMAKPAPTDCVME